MGDLCSLHLVSVYQSFLSYQITYLTFQIQPSSYGKMMNLNPYFQLYFKNQFQNPYPLITYSAFQNIDPLIYQTTPSSHQLPLLYLQQSPSDHHHQFQPQTINTRILMSCRFPTIPPLILNILKVHKGITIKTQFKNQIRKGMTSHVLSWSSLVFTSQKETIDELFPNQKKERSELFKDHNNKLEMLIRDYFARIKVEVEEVNARKVFDKMSTGEKIVKNVEKVDERGRN